MFATATRKSQAIRRTAKTQTDTTSNNIASTERACMAPTCNSSRAGAAAVRWESQIGRLYHMP
jgi:hypothetical protein